MKKHDRWLAWKIKVGLANRGRPGPMHPKGLIAKFLYWAYFRFHEPKAVENDGIPKNFKQSAGSSLGASGNVK